MDLKSRVLILQMLEMKMRARLFNVRQVCGGSALQIVMKHTNIRTTHSFRQKLFKMAAMHAYC
jgi:hypothetical protein